MYAFSKITWKKLIPFLLLSVICFQIYLAIVAHQQPITSNTSIIETDKLKNNPFKETDSLEILKLNQPQQNKKQQDSLQTLVDDIAKSKRDQLIQERKKHIARHSRHDINRRFRTLRRQYQLNNDDDDDSRRHKKLNRMRKRRAMRIRRNPFHDANSREDRIDFEKANLKKYMEDGGWIDADKIPKDGFIYKERVKQINITKKLNNDNTINAMYKYDNRKDEIINNKWNKKDIDKLMNNKNKLFSEYGIIPYESKMNYDLQLLEYDILRWIINHQYRIKCPTEYFEIGVLKECGFGCKLDDYILICAKYAVANGYLFEFKDWGNNNNHTLHEYGAWNTYFKPLSNVLSICNKNELKILKDGRFQTRPRKIGFWIPKEFEERIEKLHNDSVLYFNGILNRYFLRLNDKYKVEYDMVRNELLNKIENNRNNRNNIQSLIGCHVRRTDKIMESNVYEWKNYIDLIKYLLIYNNIDYNKNDNELFLFLATDDRDIVNTAIIENNNDGLKFNFLLNKYSIYIDNNNEIELKQRRTRNGLISIVFDILLLSECDLFIGQDGSRVSRLVLELIAMRLPDYKQKMISIDAVNNNLLDFPYWISQNWLY